MYVIPPEASEPRLARLSFGLTVVESREDLRGAAGLTDVARSASEDTENKTWSKFILTLLASVRLAEGLIT